MSHTPPSPRFGFGGSGTQQPISTLTGDQVVSEYANIVEGALRRLPHRARTSTVTGLEDLRQEGLLALVQAARTFAPERGVPFPAYARRCIENALVSALRKHDILPESVRRDAQALQVIEDDYRRSAEPLTVFELSLYSGLSEERVMEVRDWLNREHSIVIDGDTETAGRSFGSTWQSAEDEALAEEETRALLEAVNRLPERSRRILLARVVYDTPVRTVAQQEGLSPARISQIYGEVKGELIDLIL